MKAWLFDIDGVITDLVEKKITKPQILQEIAKRIENSEPVGFNTGRSSIYIIEQILDRLREIITDDSLLESVFCVGEKSGISIVFKEGAFQEQIDAGLTVPVELKDDVKKLAGEYSDILFFDDTKQTMISIEMNDGGNVEEFQKIVPEITEKIQLIIKKHKMESSFKIDPTTIALDVQHKNVGKKLGTRKFVEFIKEKGISVDEYLCFGDSELDFEMYHELKDLGLNAKIIFVGKKEIEMDNPDVVRFPGKFDEGTLEYLQTH